MTYEPDREVICTWIDGSQDRVRYLTRSAHGTTLQSHPTAVLALFKGVTTHAGSIADGNLCCPDYVGRINLCSAVAEKGSHELRIRRVALLRV